MPSLPRCARFAWGVLAYDIAVAAWGAYVRATGSGAGCGSHWPLCNGVLVPTTARVATTIEYSHRISSGLDLVLTFALLGAVWRAFPPPHAARKAALAAAGFIVIEALLGASLVLLKHVEHDESIGRAVSGGLHLVNTFFLLGSTALTAWWTSGFAPPRLRGQQAVLWLVGACLLALLLVGASGAVTALGDTLFPPSSVAAGLRQDFSARAHLFVRLRTLHPLFASAAAMLVVLVAALIRALRPTPAVRWLSRAAAALVTIQIGAGLLNVLTLAPVWLQLVHLVLADAVWVSLVLTGAAASSVASAEVSARAVGDGPAFT